MSKLEKSIQEEKSPIPGLYIHIPFCKSKCPYCDFYSLASSSLVPRWLDSLKKEILIYKDRFTCFDTVYLGGGTPSLLDVCTIEEILGAVNSSFNIPDDAEITIEANPGDINPDKISALKDTGLNRINLGVQSFNDDELLFLGRRHKCSDSVMALDMLRQAGFNNIGIDLIYGLKGQTLDGWLKTLETGVSFKPEHISCYQLTIEGKTLFNVLKKKGELAEISEDEAGRFFLETSEFLEQHGYVHYEVSNFSGGLELRSAHNSKYWQRVPYLGLGPSAHSFDGKKRWWNVSSVKKYCEALEHNRAPVDDYESLSEEQALLEKISLGLRTVDGIDLDELRTISGAIEKIKQLAASGHIKILNNAAVSTKKGLLVADQLPLYIIQ